MTNLLLDSIVFPTKGDWIAQAVYGLLRWIMSWPGFLSYGFGILVFGLLIKLIFSPMDFINKYFTKKNQLVAQRLAPEEAALRKTYANDPMAFNRAKQELYAKNGGGQGGFCLVMIINLVITFTVFIGVFNSLRTVANNNINYQVNELQAVYAEYKEGGTKWVSEEVLAEKLNEKYNETSVSFMWVKNIWQPDTFWSSETLSYNDFKNARNDGNVDNKSNISEADYKAMFSYINKTHSGSNGWMGLILLAGATSFLSAWLTMFISRKQQPKKAVGTKEEPIITYSLRDAKAQNYGEQKQPTVDPAMMGKMMMYIMPIIMIIFALTSTSAMAIYIISSSVSATALSLLWGFLVDLIIKHQKPKEKKGSDFDPTIINPHAKYFKNKK